MMIKKLSFLIAFLLVLFNVSAQVTAGFTANQTAGCPNPLLLVLSDNSSSNVGPIDSWNWTLTGPAGFTTETSSTNQLSTTLSIPGMYSVTLTVCSGATCDTETQTNYIEVYEPPTISMAISPLTGCPPHEVCFDGTFDPGCGTVASSLIDVKDGTVYNDIEDVCHTYSASGTYTNFTVSVTNSCGCITTENFTDVVTVSPAPNASFSANNTFSCTSPMNVTFTNTSTNTVAGTTYEWNIPGVVNGANTPNLTQSFTTGSYDVEFIVTNPNGCSDTVFLPNYIVVGNPNANFDSDVTSVCPGGTINFNDLSSGNPISWLWTFEGHGTSTLQNPSRGFTTVGTWDVTLAVTYQGGCADTITIPNYITVNPLPVNSFTVSDSGSCVNPFTTTFTSTSTNAATTTWSFPGGTPNTFTGSGPVNVTYNSFGNYNVTMTSTSAAGCSSTTNFSNVISIQQLQAQIIIDSSEGCIPLGANLSYNLVPSSVAASQTWTLPGSNIGNSSLANPNAVYNTVGCNDVTLDVTTTDGCVVSTTLPNAICAGNPPTGVFSMTPDSLCFEADDVCVDYLGLDADTILWDFGDGSPLIWGADDAQICYTYSNDIGDFSITMMPFQYGCPGDTVIYVDTVQVLGPIAVFSSNFQNCDNWNTFEFTNESVEADSVYWDFGDPTTTLDFSSDSLTQWTYPAIDSVKTYDVTLYAYNFTTGCEHQVTSTISVFPAIADFTYSSSVGCAPRFIQFQNTSLQPRTLGNLTKWNWDNTMTFSGPGQGVVWSQLINTSYVYTEPGVYSVSMTYQNTRGCRDTITKPNIISIFGIDAGFTLSDTLGCGPLTVNFTDTSNPYFTYVDSVHWDFGITSSTIDTSILSNPSFTYTEAGTYTVTLTAVDSFGCIDTETRTIVVNDPEAVFTVSDTFVCNNQSVSLNNLSTGEIETYNWQFQNASPSSSILAQPGTITFNAEGFQDIYLEVTDSLGCTDDTIQTISVFDVVAQATASDDTVLCFANVTAITFNNTSFNNVDSSSVWWDLGNGVISNLYNPSAVYNVAGEYVVTMGLSSNTGCSDTTIVDTIFVGGPYADIEVIGRDSGCYCDTISFAITTLNSSNPSFISGDGGFIPYVPNGVIGDTIVDTLSYAYCQLGSFIPQVFIDDGTCSGNVPLNDTIFIDSLAVNFSHSAINFCDTGTVCFFDSSFNAIQGDTGVIAWEWDFGDGNTSIDQNPCNTYTAPGLYTVTLVAHNTLGCSDSISYNIYIPESPIADFGVSDSNGCVGITIQLFDSSTAHTNSQIDTWLWDFGNATQAITQNATVTYSSAGVYTVSLIVTDTFNCTAIDSVDIEVFDLPTVTAGNDTFMCLGDSIQIQSSGANTYSWIPNYTIVDDSVQNPIIYPSIDTSYVVIGIDTNGCENSDTILIDVNTLEASFLSDTVCLNDTSFFTDISTADGTITDWFWDFGVATLTDDTSILQNPSYFYPIAGTFPVSLTITDNFFCTDDTIQNLTVINSPIASFTADTVCLGTTTSFTSTSNSFGANILSYHWDFGVTTLTNDTSNLENPSYLYTNPGFYTVCLTVVTDLNCVGNTDDTCFVVEVYELPDVSFTADSTCLGFENSFTDFTTVSTSGIITAIWDFDQNPQDTLLLTLLPATTSFVYDNVGQYFVNLTVTDSNGCINGSTQTAYVFDNPIADFTFITACQNQTNTFTSLPLQGDNSNLNYYWDFDEGAGFQLGDSIQLFSFANAGNHTITHVIEDAFGCTDTIQNNLVVSAAPVAVIVGDNTVCQGLSTFLDASSSVISVPPAIFDWSVTASQTSAITYSPSADATVFLTVTDDNGCVDSTSIDIDVLEGPEAEFSWSPPCENIPIELTGESIEGDAVITAFTYNISGNNSGNSTYNTEDAFHQVNQADTLSATYIVTDANNCIDSVTYELLVDAQVNINVVTPEYLICFGDTITLNINDTTQFLIDGVGSVSWSPNSNISANDEDSILAYPAQTTTYTLTGYSELNNCPPDDDNTIVIQVPPVPVINVDAYPNPVLAGAISEITATVAPYNVNTDSLVWDNSSGTLNTNFGFLLEATPLEETNYPAQLIYYYDSLRCTIDTFINIQIISECNNEIIYAPNIFTPNDDTKNDEFKISGYGIEVINYLRVFDRWGQLMYEGNNILMNGNGRMPAGSGWFGDNKGGKKCNSGVYVYSYELVCSNGDIVRGSGNITLIK